MATQAPTDSELEQQAERSRRATRRLLNAARDAAKELARFEEQLAARGIGLHIVDTKDDHGPE